MMTKYSFVVEASIVIWVCHPTRTSVKPAKIYKRRFSLRALDLQCSSTLIVGCAARGRPIIVEWERDARHSAGLSLVRTGSCARAEIITTTVTKNDRVPNVPCARRSVTETIPGRSSRPRHRTRLDVLRRFGVIVFDDRAWPVSVREVPFARSGRCLFFCDKL
ncbi:hypothetical protein EVAR_4342_1 [Eumeta japonica]|uniref:Uncharacterized protein n=1 Tax=Eumeta variegata TaxID=151549 RepID=A0A4C1VD47_EUMVA|nr:hypothetical protein EVAR_4342_1 [Eumeta japonica]